jgi:hypothetical protein
MGRGKSWIVAGVLGVLVTLPGSPCQAEDALPTSVRVLGDEPDMTFEVVPRGQRTEGQRCGNPCEVRALPGRYQLRVFRGTQPLGGRSLRIDGPAEVRVAPPNVARQHTGFALGVTGSALAVIGIGTVAYGLINTSACASYDDRCHSDQYPTLAAGGLTFIAGAVLAPIGWVIYGLSKGPKLTITPLSPAPRGAAMNATLAF